MSKYHKNPQKLLPKNEYFQKIMTVEQTDNSLFTPIFSPQTIKKSATPSSSNKYASQFQNKYAPQKSNVIAKSMSQIKKSGTGRGIPIPEGDSSVITRMIEQFVDTIINLKTIGGTPLNADISGIKQAAIRQIANTTGYTVESIQNSLNKNGVFENIGELINQRVAETGGIPTTSASIPSSATTTSSITPDASSLPTTSDSSSSFNPFVVPPTAPQPLSKTNKIVNWLMQLPSDIKKSKEFKQVMRELTRLPKDIKRGNAIPRLLNALSTSQRNADIAAGRNATHDIFGSKLPLVTVKQLEEDASLRNPFNRPRYSSDFLGNVNVRSSNPYMQDLQYLFNHYWNDPRARGLRSVGQLGAGLSLASAIGSQILPPLYGLALNAYNAYANTPENKPENNNQTNTPSSTVTQQDVQSMQPIVPKYPDARKENENKMAIQDVAENFNRQFFGSTGKGQLIFEQPILENYNRILPTLFPENASKFQEISQNLINSYAPLFMSKSPTTTTNPYEGKQENNYVVSRVKELKQNRIKEQLKDFYENEIPSIRKENYMLSDEDVNTILASKATEFANSYGEKEYKKDASLAMSELQNKILRNTYDKMSEFIYPIAEKEFDRGRKYDSRSWLNPAKWFSPKLDQEYFIPPGEKDKIILQNSNLVHFNTQPKPPEYFEVLFTKTPKYPKTVEEQYQYPGKPNDIPYAYPGRTQKRASKQKSKDIIQKSLAPKYQPVSKNKYLKEK